MRCDDCINRRQFLSAAAGAAGLAVVGCGDGVVTGPFADALTAPVSIVVADFPALATAGTLVQLPGHAVVVTRVGPASFDAFSMICTHQGCTTSITDAGQRLTCPCHLSRFANDGSVVNGPSTGEGIGPLRRYVTSYNHVTDTLTIS